MVTCLHPKVIFNKYLGSYVSVPCGRCSSCITARSYLWKTRLEEESTCHTYTLFGTLTYSDSHLPVFDFRTANLDGMTDEFLDCMDESLDYITYCDYKVPCFDIKHIQGFFKRLRSKIYYEHKANIRYFIVGEIGPTTYRPHFHFLLWFDVPDLVPHIKEYIYQAWKRFTDCESLSSFLRRNKLSFVHGHAEGYVASYINSFYELPKIFTQKPFRPFHVQSSAPAIGTLRISLQSLQESEFKYDCKVDMHRLSSVQFKPVSLWSGLENRYFPKCVGFSFLSSRDRISLYKISSLFGLKSGLSFKAFAAEYLPKWFSPLPIFVFVRKLCRASEGISVPDEKCKSFLRRLFYVSKRVHQLAVECNISIEAYVQRIVEYFQRKDYLSLIDQLKFQVSLSNSPRTDVSLSYYPFIIDSCFAENLRNLKNYGDYLSQFDLQPESMHLFSMQFSLDYISKKSISDKIYYDNRKVKIKKDYVFSHPECYLYSYLLNPFKL